MLYIAQKSSAFSPRMELPATQAKRLHRPSPPARTQSKTANPGRLKFAATQSKSACADSIKNRQLRANEIRVYTGNCCQSRRMKWVARQAKSAQRETQEKTANPSDWNERLHRQLSPARTQEKTANPRRMKW